MSVYSQARILYFEKKIVEMALGLKTTETDQA